jgi:hypothetical protein
MSTAVMMEPIAKVSPRFKARVAGAIYLLSVVTAAPGLGLRDEVHRD